MVDVTAPTPTITLTSNVTADNVINAAEAGATWRHRHGRRRRPERRHRHPPRQRRHLHRHSLWRHLLDRRRRLGPGCRWRHHRPCQRHHHRRRRQQHHGDRHPELQRRRDRAGADHHADLSITTDNVINAAEAGGTIAVTGTVGGDVQNGDTVTLIVNGTTYTGTVSGGTFSINVPAQTWLPMATSPSMPASPPPTPPATAQATDTQTYTVDVTAPAPTITLTSIITADDVINAAEAGGTSRSPARSAATVERRHRHPDRQRHQLHRHSLGRRLLDQRPGLGTWRPMRDFTVQAIGHHHRRGRQRRHRHRHRELHGRRHASTPTITLTSNITADDVINAAEAGGTIAITGTVGGDGERATPSPSRSTARPTPAQSRAAPSRSTCRARPWLPMRDSTHPGVVPRPTRPATWARRRDTETLHGRRDRAGADHHADLEHHGRRRHQRGRSRRQRGDHRHGRRRRAGRRHRHPDGQRHRPTPAR